MKRKALSWLLLVVAAAACHFCLRYLFGDFQGYVTVPVGGTDYGFAHIKSSTVWVSGSPPFTPIPGVAPVAALASIIALGFAVRFTYRTVIRRRINAA
jgi:hypothetical protein